MTVHERRLSWLARLLPVPKRNLHFVQKYTEAQDYFEFTNSPPEVWEFYRQNSGATRASAVAHRALMLDRLDLRPLLPAVRQKVLMIGGDRDHIIPYPLERELLAALPDARRVEFTGYGHHPCYTRPAETADAVREFFAG